MLGCYRKQHGLAAGYDRFAWALRKRRYVSRLNASEHDPINCLSLHTSATDRTEAAIAQAQRAGQPEIRFIVGKGMHSDGHKAKIKPAIVDLMQK